MGADGVLVSGCHFEDCHYSFGARKAAFQYQKLEKIVRLLGFEKERTRQEFISAAEFPKFAKVVREMVEQVRKLGPNQLFTWQPGNLPVNQTKSEVSATV
jgi:coenzyme F420-reducing hydrogenase delta subunit